MSFNKRLTITYWNIRSLYPKFEDFVHCINVAEAEIVFIGETWLNTFISYDLPGYNAFRRDRDKNSNKLGVRSLVADIKDKLDVTEMADVSLCKPHLATLTLKLKLPSVKEIYYVGVYRPPVGNLHLFLDDLEKLIYSLNERLNFEINTIRDVNINLNRIQYPTRKKYKDWLKPNHPTSYESNLTSLAPFLTELAYLHCRQCRLSRE